MGPWLRRYQHDGQSAMTLVCLPDAGGTAAMFSSWHPLLPSDIELIGVQYPGREERMAEPYVENLSDVADQVAAELAELRDRPVALFGHGVGSAIAYEIAVRLEQNTDVALRHIFVSARKAPHREHGETNHRLGDEDLIALVRRLGGWDIEAPDLPELRPIILEPLRADLRMADTHRPMGLTSLRTPITAFSGDSGQTCAPQDLETWREATFAEFDIQVFGGGHHYLTEDAAPVVEAIVRRLRPMSLDQEIAALWRELLDGREVGVDDDFFQIGGNSLIGIRIINRVWQDYGVELPVRDFYLAQTPARVAELIEKERASL